jgi:hypothetical protein
MKKVLVLLILIGAAIPVMADGIPLPPPIPPKPGRVVANNGTSTRVDPGVRLSANH